MTAELLIFAALWCGNPIIGERLMTGGLYRESMKRTHAQVDACREKLIACIEAKTPLAQCAKDAKLNE